MAATVRQTNHLITLSCQVPNRSDAWPQPGSEIEAMLPLYTVAMANTWC